MTFQKIIKIVSSPESRIHEVGNTSDSPYDKGNEKHKIRSRFSDPHGPAASFVYLVKPINIFKEQYFVFAYTCVRDWKNLQIYLRRKLSCFIASKEISRKISIKCNKKHKESDYTHNLQLYTLYSRTVHKWH